MTAPRTLRLPVPLLLALLLALLTPLPAAAQEAAPAVLPASVPHSVYPGESTLTIQWQSETPVRGSILYGLAPGALASMAFEAPEPRTDHTITLSSLPAGAAVYYLIGSGGAPVGKDGEPYIALTNAPEAALPDVSTAAPQPYTEAAWGVSFLAPAGWSAAHIPLEDEGTRILQWSGDAGSISVDRLPNPDGLSPQEWFAAHRADFDATLAQPAGTPVVDGAAALVVAQPATCRSAPLLAAFVARDDALYQIMLADNGGRAAAPEFGALLASWRFGSAPADAGAAALDAALTTFPVAPASVDCAATAATAAPAGVADAAPRCPGAAMTVPTAGPNTQPWGCFNSDPICYPYSPTSARGSYFRLPHRGIDLGGETGVSPVYATHAGRVYKYRDNNILLQFSAPFAGKSAWMAHMASYDGRIDYRRVTNGQIVSEGQFIGYVGYRITDGPPHLHISYLMNSGGSEGWPSIDPTRVLSIKDAVWFDGWNAEVPPACAAPSADSFEPDGFTFLAPTLTTDGTPQRHDFHAPGDEDFIRFAATAGKTYLIETYALDPNNDTTIAVLNSTGVTTLAENDDAWEGSFASGLLFTPTYTGNYMVRVRHYSFRGYLPLRPQPTYTYPVYGENTGYSLIVEQVLPNVMAGRPAYATSYDVAQGHKANLAVDGNTETRWSSQPNLPPTQWWWGETGNKYYNTATIRWEAPYAGRYFLGWSTNNITYSGYYYEVDGPGWYAHDLVLLRSARYVGVRMEELAPGQTQYSMAEVEAFRRFGPLAADAAALQGAEPGAEQPIELTPASPLVTITLEGERLDHSIYLPAVTNH